ncbi:MAG: hypothetical protein ACLSHC_13595 [Bilophila wadsworthia]
MNIQGPDASGVRARGIAEAALKRLSILPQRPCPTEGGCAAAPPKLQLFPAVHRSPFPCHTREW